MLEVQPFLSFPQCESVEAASVVANVCGEVEWHYEDDATWVQGLRLEQRLYAPDVLEVSSSSGLRQQDHPEVTLRFTVTCRDTTQCRIAYTPVLVCTDRHTRRLAAVGTAAWAATALAAFACLARRWIRRLDPPPLSRTQWLVTPEP